MRIGTKEIAGALAALGLAIACSACGADATGQSSPLSRHGGGFAGSGAPGTGGDTSASNAGGSPQEGSTPSPPIVKAADAGSPATAPDAGIVAPGSGAGNGSGNGAGAGNGSGQTGGGSQTSAGGCANGCADGCLTLAIDFCKTATADFADFCGQVPATCACNTTGATSAPPSLDQCIADIEAAGNAANGDDTTN